MDHSCVSMWPQSRAAKSPPLDKITLLSPHMTRVQKQLTRSRGPRFRIFIGPKIQNYMDEVGRNLPAGSKIHGSHWMTPNRSFNQRGKCKIWMKWKWQGDCVSEMKMEKRENPKRNPKNLTLSTQVGLPLQQHRNFNSKPPVILIILEWKVMNFNQAYLLWGS